tara:strand:+ start:2283 stop:2774 length:492 start_codon:yes stop_codon:yes gene_type:complete
MPITSPVNPIRSDDTLTTLLCHAVSANRSERKTLTLVLPEHVALQPDFFCDLAGSWRVLRKKLSLGEGTELKVDYCSDADGLGILQEAFRRIEQWRCQHNLKQQKLHGLIKLSRCLIVGKPTRDASAVVMGVAEPSVSLPDWAEPAQISMPGYPRNNGRMCRS